MAKLLEVDVSRWKDEAALIREHLASFGDRLPDELREQVDRLEERLEAA